MESHTRRLLCVTLRALEAAGLGTDARAMRGVSLQKVGVNIRRKSSRRKDRAPCPCLSQEDSGRAGGGGGLSPKGKPGMPVPWKRRGPHAPEPGQGGVSLTVSAPRVGVDLPQAAVFAVLAKAHLSRKSTSYSCGEPGSQVPQTARGAHTGSSFCSVLSLKGHKPSSAGPRWTPKLCRNPSLFFLR